MSRFGVAKNKIAKAHVLFHEVTKVETHLLRVLINKAKAFFFGFLSIVRLRTFHYQRHVLVAFSYLAQQLKPGLGVFNTIFGKSHITDNTQYIVGVFFVISQSLFVGSGEHHLGSAPHSQCSSMAVECFGGYTFALNQDITVKIGQDRRIKTDAIFNKKNSLHARLFDIMVNIHLVFD